MSIEEAVRNAELREALAPYEDDSLTVVYTDKWSVREENNYLSDLLDWEHAPVRPIAEYFNPPLDTPKASSLSDSDVHSYLDVLIQKLYEKKYTFDFTDHLSDRALYNLIVGRILPSREKKLASPRGFRHWDCSYIKEGEHYSPYLVCEEEHRQLWLAYYASDEERNKWETMFGETLPPKQAPLFSRDLPGDPE